MMHGRLDYSKINKFTNQMKLYCNSCVKTFENILHQGKLSNTNALTNHPIWHQIGKHLILCEFLQGKMFDKLETF